MCAFAHSLDDVLERADTPRGGVEGTTPSPMAEENSDQLGIGPVEVPEHLRAHYANFVNINHTPWDFRLVFAVVKAPMPGHEAEAAQAEGSLHPEAVAEVVIPANLIHGLIMALQTNFDRYLEHFGVPGMNPQGPQQQQEEDEAQ